MLKQKAKKQIQIWKDKLDKLENDIEKEIENSLESYIDRIND